MNALKRLIAYCQANAALHNAEDVVGMAALGALVTGLYSGQTGPALIAGCVVAVIRTLLKLLPSLELQANAALTQQVNQLTARLTAVENAPAPAPSPTRAQVETLIAAALQAAQSAQGQAPPAAPSVSPAPPSAAPSGSSTAAS